ncbi:MAG: MATE family efflux transporter, partial [Lachnospiraceae bacterium]|nr:MATE family efflux transporter [Lachnospiraceae bacterium]
MEQDQNLLQEETKENKMGTMPIPRLLTGMALPMVISMMVQACYNIVDSIFVAKIKDDVIVSGSAGTAALNAVGMAFPVQMLLIAFGTGTCVGVNAVLSKALGEKDQKTADQAANNGVFLAVCNFLLFLIFGVFFSGLIIRM